jgi:ABC-type sugar transport system ATPase subunit/ribose/xylose/arabinose/galactoside ABC-type transport system permease subunit
VGDGVLLRAKGVTKTFPGVVALDNVDFDLRAGEVHILLGENGAGKSTLVKILSGAYAPDAGEVFIEDRKVEAFDPRVAQQLGVSIIYQELNLASYLNVAENIFLSRFPKKHGLIDHEGMHAAAAALLASLNMHVDTHALIVELTTPQQQMVEIAKALLIDSNILIMDEPTSSLSVRETEQLFATIHKLTSQGIGIIYISHRLQELHEVGDRVTVLRDGQFIGCKVVDEVTIDELIGMMVGHSVDEMFERDFLPQGAECLRVENLSSGKRLQNVSIILHFGEILGLAGLVGSGRTDLAHAIFGVDRYDSGRIVLFGQEMKDFHASDMVDLGVSLIPEDRKQQGLALILPVAENIVVSSLDRLFPKFFISKSKEREIAMQYVDRLRIATPSTNRLAQYLSGGNQQKVVLAKWLCTKAKVFIFDEPTRGIDVGAKAEIHAFMNELVKEGAAVMMISSELPEVIGMSDRIYVMREGRIVAELSHAEATQERIIHFAMGADEAKKAGKKVENGNGALMLSQPSDGHRANTRCITMTSQPKSKTALFLIRMPSAAWVILLMIAICTAISDRYLTVHNLVNIVEQNAMLLIVALGATLVLLSEGIDLSQGSVVSLGGVNCVYVMKFLIEGGMPNATAMVVGVLVGLMTGLVMGTITGGLVAIGKLPSFIASLGMMGVGGALALVVADSSAIYINNPVFVFLGAKLDVYIDAPFMEYLSVPTFIAAVIFIAVWVVLYHTPFGRYIIAIGGNEAGSRLSGVNIIQWKWLVYVVSGLLASVGGVILAARIEAADSIVGAGWEFDAIAAAILGGTSFLKGKGGIGGTVLGVLVIGVTRNGLNVIGVPSLWQPAMIGTIVILAIVFEIVLSRWKESRRWLRQS